MMLRSVALLLAAVAVTGALGNVNAAAEHHAAPGDAVTSEGLVHIPLKRHLMAHGLQQYHHAERRAVHLQQQVDRIRRRLGEAVEVTNAKQPAGVGTLVYNDVPLRVGIGTHYAELYIGVPAQRASVIVDTGSHLTALPCSTCKGCGTHTDPLYDIKKSTTAAYATCDSYESCNSCNEDKCYISQSYTEGSMWSAVVVNDLVWLGGFKDKHANAILKHYGFHFPLGCQTEETGLFITQKENGIMGMGRHQATVLAYMLRAGRVEHNIFSMCFSDQGGRLVLGGIDFSHHRTKVEYTPLITASRGWYAVNVKDILVGGKTLGIDPSDINSGKGVIVDSGTTDTFFTSKGSRAFASIFSNIAGITYSDNLMPLSAETLASLPNISIVLEGSESGEDFILEVPASKYLTPDGSDNYYGNFHFTERSGGVIGASTMIGYDVVFDSEQNRVGFVESDCDAAHSILHHNASFTTTTDGSSTVYSFDNTASGHAEPIGDEGIPDDDDVDSTEFEDPDGEWDDSSDISNQSETNASSISSPRFFAEILVVSVMGVLILVVWRRVRRNSWSLLTSNDTARSSMQIDGFNNTARSNSSRGEDTISPSSSSFPSPTTPLESPTSPTGPTAAAMARRLPSPRFTIGSDSESEYGGSPRQQSTRD